MNPEQRKSIDLFPKDKGVLKHELVFQDTFCINHCLKYSEA
jgi:hypothetical protein